VQGPYLVRGAAIDGNVLTLTGDWKESIDLDIYAPSSIQKVVFNGKTIRVNRTRYGSLLGRFLSAASTSSSIKAQLPPLTKWKVIDGLPERNGSYDDSRWTGRVSQTTFRVFC
jgi:hypothetical protein